SANVDINDRGDVAFPGQVSTSPDNFTAFVWRSATGTLEEVPRPPGVATGFVSTVSINNRGDVAFEGSKDLSSGLFSGVGAVYLSSGSSTISVAALKDAAPGGGLFKTLGDQLRLNNRGDLA